MMTDAEMIADVQALTDAEIMMIMRKWLMLK